MVLSPIPPTVAVISRYAVFMHAGLNSYNQGVFENLTEKTSNLTNYISGEFGLMMSLVAAFAGYLFWRKRDALPTPQ